MNVLTIANWRKHYEVMSEEQLETEIKLKEVRRIQLREVDGTVKSDGWRIFAGHLAKLFKDELAAYTTSMKEEQIAALAKSWAIHLEKEYVLFGIDGIRAAMRAWVDTDESPYIRFPKVAYIKAACKELKGSPEHELGLRKQREAEAKIEEEHRMMMAQYKAENPERWREIEREAAKRRAAAGRAS